jgi:hypothetical protein
LVEGLLVAEGVVLAEPMAPVLAVPPGPLPEHAASAAQKAPAAATEAARSIKQRRVVRDIHPPVSAKSSA